VTAGALVTVACVQLAPVMGDAARSAANIGAAVRRAAAGGATVVVLPELANTGYMFTGIDELTAAAEPLDGPYLTQLAELASTLDLVIVSGLAELGESGDIHNSAVLVDGDGLRASYRKAHLWNTEKTSGFTPGIDDPPVVDTAAGRIGIMVCYDLEFPEWVRRVALDGAELLSAPVNWPLYPRPEGERPGEIIRVQADAAVNRMFIAVADRVGRERGQDWLGGTVIVDADGYPVSRIRLGEEHIATATIELAEARDKSISPLNDVHADRRPELYG
jgi:predicted amidohydrolase